RVDGSLVPYRDARRHHFRALGRETPARHRQRLKQQGRLGTELVPELVPDCMEQGGLSRYLPWATAPEKPGNLGHRAWDGIGRDPEPKGKWFLESLPERTETVDRTPMQPQDFRPDDLFARIDGLVETVDAERRLRERVEAADRAKSDLLAVVSHELRTPMSAVISMSELLLNGPLDTTQRRYAETLQQSANSLLTVLNAILDFSKLEAGRFELDHAVFDLHELVRSVGGELQARTREKGIEGVVNIGPSCPRFVVGDASRVRQVLTNLIDNAVKFTSAGSVRLHA